MGYTISCEKRIICKGLDIEKALEWLRRDLETLCEGEDADYKIWNEGD
jgi:hypothetical protein